MGLGMVRLDHLLAAEDADAGVEHQAVVDAIERGGAGREIHRRIPGLVGYANPRLRADDENVVRLVVADAGARAAHATLAEDDRAGRARHGGLLIERADSRRQREAVAVLQLHVAGEREVDLILPCRGFARRDGKRSTPALLNDDAETFGVLDGAVVVGARPAKLDV